MMNKSIKIQEKRKKKLKSFMDGVENTSNLTPLSLSLSYLCTIQRSRRFHAHSVTLI